MKFCLVEFFYLFQENLWLVVESFLCDFFKILDRYSKSDSSSYYHWELIIFSHQVVIFLILGKSDLLLYPRQFSIVLEESMSCFMTLFGFSMIIDFYSELWFSGGLMFRALQDYDHQFSLSKIINLPTCLWCCHLILWASEYLLLGEGSQLWACGHRDAPLGKNL